MGAGVGAIVAAAPAAAQDYTSGAISGTVKDDVGNAVSGATVTITSTGQGTVRTATTNSSGSFLVNGLPIGAYDVAVSSGSGAGYRAEGINLLSSQTAQLNIQLAAAGTNDIVVTGARAVASFSGTTTGLNVDVADFIATKPLGRDLTSIILLAPGTNVGDSTFGNVPAIGGASVAENAYYLNGLNLTNFDNYIGSATVPFYFYQSVETKIGGYPAEFGRATGGIVNAVTKSGSNDFTAAVHIDWAPNFLRSRAKDTLSFQSAAAGVTRNTNRAFDEADSLLATVEAGGPIIRDKLFVYGLAQFTRTSSLTNNPRVGTATQFRNNDPFWGVKVDAFPIDSQHLEFTIFDTRNTNERSDIPYSLDPTTGVPIYGAATAVTGFQGGGLNYVGKYTGRFTDFLTLSAAYGRVRDNFNQVSIAGSGNLPRFQNGSGGALFGVPNGGDFNAQRIASLGSPYDTERKFFRADADVRFSLLGDHHIRGGYEQEKLTLNHVTVRNGGAFEFANNFISATAFNTFLGNAGVQLIARPADANGPVVELNYFNTGGAFKGKNQAYYIQDEWNLFDRLTLTLGARRDDFRVDKPSGNPIAILKKNYAPRLGAEFDVFGDKSGKLFGSYNWYYLPIASNTSFRQGAPSYFFRQRFNFSGLTPQGLPILTGLVTNQGAYQTTCPFALTPGGPTTNCSVTGNGTDIDTTQAISSNLKATRESEIVVGYQQKFGDWTLGLSYTHRNLDRTAEDSAIDAAVNAYCAANNIAPVPTGGGAAVACSDIFTGFNQYVINNPGKDITVNLLAPGFDINGRQVTLTAAQLGYGKATRKYDAVTFQFDKKWNGTFSFGGSYTWSKSRGNSEGFVQSDFGQVDAGITQDFDQPGFIPGASGLLPNDRRHNIKLFGNVALGEAFVLGLNTQISSPRPLSCFGFNPTDVFANVYGAASHYCGGVLSPRGTASKSDWYQTINIAGRYNVKFNDQTVTLRFDVFNLLNSQNATERNEIGDLDVVTGANGLPTSYIPNPDYNRITAYQARRYVRLGMDVAF